MTWLDRLDDRTLATAFASDLLDKREPVSSERGWQSHDQLPRSVSVQSDDADFPRGHGDRAGTSPCTADLLARQSARIHAHPAGRSAVYPPHPYASDLSSGDAMDRAHSIAMSTLGARISRVMRLASFPMMALRALVVSLAACIIVLGFDRLESAIDARSVAAQATQMDLTPAQLWAGLFVLGIILSCALFPMSVFAICCGMILDVTEALVLVLLVTGLSSGIEQALGKRLVCRSHSPHLLRVTERLRPYSQEHGTITVLAVRMSPFMPFALSNYAMGTLDLRFRDVFWGNIIGVLPRAILLVGFAGSVRGADAEWFSAPGVLLLLLPACLGFALLVWLIVRGRRPSC